VTRMGVLKEQNTMDWSETKELFEKYLKDLYTEDGDLNENSDEGLFEIVDKQIRRFWNQTKYKPTEVMTLMLVTKMVKEADLKYVNHIYEMCRIKISPKDRKRGRKAILEKMLKRYHKKFVRNTLNGILETFSRREIKVMKTIKEQENPFELLDELVEKVGLLGVLWPIENVLKDEKLKEMIVTRYSKRYAACLVQLALFYEEIDYPTIMESPESIESRDLSKELSKMKQEQKLMQMKLAKKEKETSKLKREIHVLQQEKRKLASEIHTLYKNSLEEIEKLKREKEEIEEYYLSVIEHLSNQLFELQQEIAEIQKEQPTTYDLQGKTIAVIGGSKERHYREIIESYNGKMTFAAEDDFLKIKGAIQKADAVFFLKEVVGHHFFKKAYPLAKKYKLPFIFINSIGKSTFERELQRFIKQQCS
jgi:hypothetical protein